MTSSLLRCHSCGAERLDAYPFRCENSGTDGGDHVLTRVLDPAGLTVPETDGANPFITFRQLLHSYKWAGAQGMADAEWVDLAGALHDAVGVVADRRMGGTPLTQVPSLGTDVRTSNVWVKDETGQPGGSHKVRHLFGTMLHLQAAAAVGAPPVTGPLAIASCGNAALAAAVIARAVQRELVVFVPEWADAGVVARLGELGATLEVCPRDPGEEGDPCVIRFRDAVQRGAVPFSCQGPDNALALDGGRTLAWELVGIGPIDRIYVQVGGGALASSLVQGLAEAYRLGATDHVPVVHAVQTAGGFPIVRAYERLQARAASTSLDDATKYAAIHRREFMWPWEEEPVSIATGILDDEVYDWLEIVHAMVASGGSPVVVDDDHVRDAQNLGSRVTGIPVSPTGAAGLAGLLATGAGDVPAREQERVVVLFTG